MKINDLAVLNDLQANELDAAGGTLDFLDDLWYKLGLKKRPAPAPCPPPKPVCPPPAPVHPASPKC